ncbi:MAG: hypothetical protein SOH99_13585 [Acidipropionibacterium acidipropionici]|jgi:hypothetical protein|uniref:hypothetical protein n=1 Tax=Acidipropionibacterium acidipropionici TaxID=1748 RepID=UPI002F35E945
MNTDPHPHPHDHQAPEQQTPPEAARPDPSAGLAPEAIQAADVDREKQHAEGVDVEKPGRGVDWVRPSDLMARAGGAVSRRGIDFQDALSRRARSGIAAGAQRLSAQARRLPPLSAFGREEPVVEAPGLVRK